MNAPHTVSTHERTPGTRAWSIAPPDNDVQQCVDALAAELGRPVLLEDADLCPLAYSRHDDDVDPVRLHCILRQGTPAELKAEVMRAGLGTERSAFRIPELPRWQMAARLCIPVRAGDISLGYLWIPDSDRSMTADQVRFGQQAADGLAPLLDRASVERHSVEKTTQMLLRRLLDGDGDAAGAAADLVAYLGLPNEARAVVMVAEVAESCTTVQSGSPEAIEMALAIGSRLHGARTPARWLVYPSDRISLLAIVAESTVVDHLATMDAARRALEVLFRSRVTLGANGPAEPLGRARSNRRRAWTALTVASSVDGPGTVRSWSDLGYWRLLSRLAQRPDVDDDLVADLHPGVLELLREDRANLLSTVETYFEHAGDAGATAAALHLHRSTLYYRLDKVRDITGMDLRSGEARFELMLGLRAALIAGLRRPKH
jgi:hypothetical protein